MVLGGHRVGEGVGLRSAFAGTDEAAGDSAGFGRDEVGVQFAVGETGAFPVVLGLALLLLVLLNRVWGFSGNRLAAAAPLFLGLVRRTVAAFGPPAAADCRCLVALGCSEGHRIINNL